MTVRLWPFASRGARVDTGLDRPGPAVSRDYAAFALNDACIKLWLPERLAVALDRLSVEHDSSRPDVLRRLLFEHVHGREAFEELRAWARLREVKAPAPTPAPVAGLPGAATPVHPGRRSVGCFGKSTEGFKLWLPAPLQADLVALAEAEGVGLSDYLRKTLVRLLLGERAYRDWQQANGSAIEG